MPADRFHLSTSAIANEQFRRAIEVARVRGQLKEAMQAGRWMFDELSRTPLEFGESRDWLPALKLKVRLAFVRPLVVQFAVNEEENIVFIMAFAYCNRG